MQTTPENETDRVNELEQSANAPAVVPARRLEQVQGAVDEVSAGVRIDDEVAPVDTAQE